MIQIIDKNEKFALKFTGIPSFAMVPFLDIPVKLQSIGGEEKRLRYERVETTGDTLHAAVETKMADGNTYRINDTWLDCNGYIRLDRRVTCVRFKRRTGIRLTTEFRCLDEGARSFEDYQFVIPGAFYNKNDTDGDGQEDYLGTYVQDYKDDRNPNLSETVYSTVSGNWISLIRADVPEKDTTVSRAQIKRRHFIHDTDIGSLGFSPSPYRTEEILLRADYPFYERNSFCLNVDGSGWAAYKEVSEGTEFTMSYILCFGNAKSLTEASWETLKLQMKRILKPEIHLPFSLEEARRYRREMIQGSYREFSEKRGKPAGYFVHFSPRKEYGKQNILEYGFCGAQTLLAMDMLTASWDNGKAEYRTRALKTLDFLVDSCMADSGLPNGIYCVDTEEFVYWWTGILLPFQYSKDRKELERYLGSQVVGALMRIASELEKTKGNYCRSMVDTMYYLMKCYLFEEKNGCLHPTWLQAVVKFCDCLLEMQNEDGSWNRGYTMEGIPLTKPVEWFGANEKEQHSGVIFPAPLLTALYRYTGDKKYLDAAVRAANCILKNYAQDLSYIGGINDTSHKKSVKLDAASAMFAMRSLLCVYEETKEEKFLQGAVDAAKILATWTYLWDIPFDKETLLGRHGFCSTGWAGCDVIPAGSYVDCSFQEVVPDLLRVAEYKKDAELAQIAQIVTMGMQNGLSMPADMYGYSMPGVQCEGYMTSLWLADTKDSAFSGAAAKNKGDDNDTCNGFVNGMALWNLDCLMERYGTLDMKKILCKILK